LLPLHKKVPFLAAATTRFENLINTQPQLFLIKNTSAWQSNYKSAN